jgi:magnesium transporter
MRQTVIETAQPPFRWIDVVAPERDELVAIAKEFGFHPMSVEDCLDPWHLPKQERIGDAIFLILRVFDPDGSPRGASVQELTRKIAIFYRAGLVISIHRADLAVVRAIREQSLIGNGGLETNAAVLGALMNGALDSFDVMLDRAETAVDGFEEALLRRRDAPDLAAIHHLKRRVNVVRRLLWQTTTVIQRLPPPEGGRAGAVLQDVKDNAESYYFYADQLLDEINALLSIHVSLASHRTNQVMRVLTVFSAFFLPLTFIVGVYGMNFDWMPELRLKYGYPAVMIVIAVVSLAIAVWFRRQGWLGRERG